MPKKKTITKKKSEPQENNWWRKYTTEYQDENLEKNVSQKSTGSSVQKIEQPKKSIVHFNGSDKLPDMSGVAKEMEGMVRGLLKSNLFGKNIFKESARPRLIKMEGNMFRKPISEVQMKGNKLLVTVELPGVKKENIKIHIEGMNLIIEAQSKTGNEDKQHGFFSFSSSYTGFRHIVRLPVPVDKKSSKANYNSGILKIILTKKNQSNQAGDIDIE